MAPKSANKNASAASGGGAAQQQARAAGSSKGATKGKGAKAADDEDALLAEHALRAEEASKQMKVAKAAEDAKKAAVAAAEAARQQAMVEAAAKMPPILINDVAARAVDFMRPKLGTLRDGVWLTYVLHRFMMLVLEKHRKLALRTAAGADEAVVAIEVHDDKHPGDNHSWNVLTTKSGAVYALDLSLEQFLPSGRYGYRRDAQPEEGWVPVQSRSRILASSAAAAADQDAQAAAHAGVLALDAGILSDGVIDCTAAIAKGSYDAYIKFIVAASDGRHKNMNAEERGVAEILQRTKAVPLWLELHRKLEADFLQ